MLAFSSIYCYYCFNYCCYLYFFVLIIIIIIIFICELFVCWKPYTINSVGFHYTVILTRLYEFHFYNYKHQTNNCYEAMDRLLNKMSFILRDSKCHCQSRTSYILLDSNIVTVKVASYSKCLSYYIT